MGEPEELKTSTIDNRIYLDSVISNEESYDYVLLPQERVMLDLAEDDYRSSSDPRSLSDILDKAIEHPGVFFVDPSDYIKVPVKRAAPFLGAVAVSYPDADETRITIGSRVSLIENDKCLLVDVVGFKDMYSEVVDDDGSEVVALSVDSPLAKTIMGSEIGSELEVIVDRSRSPLEVRVIDIDQLSIVRDATKNIRPVQLVD